ncbi:hypothetical protein A3K73_08795 [Candidatus Pacearchaeota archaeon RBG_13_36_9]|nr:MAG: hypothetical protein A3K73_08795 [Candidatus Pacearchaeota archaeon RBG_13_36_9]
MAALKKRFFEIEVPLTNSSAEALTYNIESLNNKTIKLDLTRQLRGKSIEVLLKIKVEKGKAIAHPVKLTLLSFYIRRMLRRKISYVEESFLAECKDAQIRFKPFLITRKRVSRRVRNALRKEVIDWLQIYAKSKTYQEVFSDIISNRLQKPLSLKLKKIYPLALCEIRVLKLEKLREQEKIEIKEEKIEEGKKVVPVVEFNPGTEKYEVNVEETKEKIIKAIKEEEKEEKPKKERKSRKKKGGIREKGEEGEEKKE